MKFALTPLHPSATVKTVPVSLSETKMNRIHHGRGRSGATQTMSIPSSREASFASLLCLAAVLRFFLIACTIFACSIPALAQFQLPFVFTASTGPGGTGYGIAAYTRNDITGVLTPVPGSPFLSRAPVNELALDFKGRFLFAGTSENNIEMFAIDPNTGALQEVPNSPFASPTTSAEFLSTESSGQFLYVVDLPSSSNPNASAVESFQIDPVNLNLIPTAAGATVLPGIFVGGATHLSGKTFYVFVNDPTVEPNQPHFLLFDSSNGTFTQPSILPFDSVDARTLALDPQGLHLAVSAAGVVTSQDLQLDGTLGSSNVSIRVSGSTDTMIFDTLGQFLYVGPLPGDLSNSVHFYSGTTLQELPNSPLNLGFPPIASWVVDPTAPLIYADKVYQVDPQTGLPNSILSPSPLPISSFHVPTVFGRPPGSQPIVGPIALLSAMSLSFGSLSLGQTSGTQTLTILSNGGQALSLNSLAITGANAGDFTITANTCQVPGVLQPGSSCSVLLNFTPSAAGNRSAALTITDNASPPTESAQLNGTGLAPAPAVTLIPGSLDFGTVTQGTSTPLNISVKNSGNAALHISSVAIGGADANDFSSSIPTCNAAISSNSSCTITVTFAPLAPGVRTTTITITDDAPDSPQTIQIKGNANPAFTPGPAPNGSTSASVSAGQPAQYQLQLTPGAGYSGTVSLMCNGAPLGASCQLPASVAISNGVAAPFTVTVTTSGAAILTPSIPLRFKDFPRLRLLPLLALLFVVWMAIMNRRLLQSTVGGKCLGLSAVLATIILCVVFGVAGCGGGSPALLTPPPIITPNGTSTITISMSAMSSSGQPLQLQPLQLTLTVK
jgi:hypothetical protein